MNTASVIIINWNGKKFLPECLEGLKYQNFQPSSVIIVDNGSTDGSIDFINRNYPSVKVIVLPENKGFPTACNIAIKTIRSEYVALLNNDAVPHPLWLQSLIGGLENHPEAGFAASRMLFYDNRNKIDRAGDGYTRAGIALLGGRGMKADKCDKEKWVFGACAGAALYRTSMLRDIGLFDEDFFLLYEDVDLSFRSQLRGYKCLYVPTAIAYHRGSSSIVHDSPISVYYGQRNLEWVYIQNMPLRLITRTAIPHLMYNFVAFIYFMMNGNGFDFVRAKRDALKGLGKALQKRHEVQKNRIVSDAYVWGLFDKESLYQRLRSRKN